MALLEVRDLTTAFHLRSGVVRAVDRVGFALERGETLGIVGESGSGKSVTCLSLLRLIPEPPGRIESGTALFDGEDLLALSPRALRRVRGKRIAMIFQDPMTSLNPYLRISTQLIEPLGLHTGLAGRAALHKAIAALEEVGIADAARRIHAYPHQFSGGMRQRVMIAMALITEPDLLIADEPTTALDVTVQAQILELIKQRQARLGTAMILVTHDLGIVAGTCDRVAVMYGGRVLESGTVDQVFYQPRHAYTRALHKAIPSLQAKGGTLYTIPGAPPDLARPLGGCAFFPRCPYPKRRPPGGERPEFVRLGEGHCVEDCRYCDRGRPIEDVLAEADTPEAAA
jgi:oligopeptide transport system ATP-binding protein